MLLIRNTFFKTLDNKELMFFGLLFFAIILMVRYFNLKFKSQNADIKKNNEQLMFADNSIKEKNERINNLNEELKYKVQKINELKIKIDDNNELLRKKEIEINDYDLLLERFKPILSVEDELKTILIEKENLKNQYSKGLETFKSLKLEIDKMTLDIDLIESGLFIPTFEFGTSDSYKNKIINIVNLQKTLVTNKEAVQSHTEIYINRSNRTAKKIKLALKIFNGECDKIISKLNWKNYNLSMERMKKAYENINEIFKKFPDTIYITNDYLNLKYEELKLKHELICFKREESERNKEIRVNLREEEKARRDFEKAKKEAFQKEKLYKKALEEARKELGLAGQDEVKSLENKIKNLQFELDATLDKFERAKSMAQQTKRGHVYIVSNIGSFGENIYKIGMTRRLDPIDRVKELGDASVPFRFDLHAMIYTEDAPKLESLLHKKFDDFRINKVNNRKEYFNVTIEEIEDCIRENFDGEFQIIRETEAKEYNESLFIKNNEEAINLKTANDLFPDNLF